MLLPQQTQNIQTFLSISIWVSGRNFCINIVSHCSQMPFRFNIFYSFSSGLGNYVQSLDNHMMTLFIIFSHDIAIIYHLHTTWNFRTESVHQYSFRYWPKKFRTNHQRHRWEWWRRERVWERLQMLPPFLKSIQF